MDDKKIEAAIKTMAESAARILCDVVLEIIKSAPPADSAQPPAPEQECSVLENYLRMCNPQEARDWGRSSEGHTCGGEIRLWPQEICGLCGDGPIKNPGCAVVPGSNTLLPGVRGDAEAAPSIVDDGGAHVSAKIVEQIKSMSGDTEVAAPRRSWKRWACYDEMGELAEIEREAYRLGEKYGHDNGYAEAMRDMRGSTTPQPIGGVWPVVVEAWTAHHLLEGPWHSIENNLHMYRDQKPWFDIPCTVAIWTGVKNGKKVQP